MRTKHSLRHILTFLFSALLFISFNLPIHAQNTAISGEHIQNFNSTIEVKKDGIIDVVEVIQYDFSNLSRHGIYRYIPMSVLNEKKETLKWKYTVLGVTDEQGNEYQYSESNVSNTLNLKVGSANKTISGVHTYKIHYTIAGALGYFADHDEIYWNVTGNEWTVPIAQAQATIILPDTIAEKDIGGVCYSGAKGSTEQLCNYKITGNTVTFQSTSILLAGSGLTVATKFPKGVVAVLTPTPEVNYFDTPEGKKYLPLLGIIFLLLLGGAFVWYLVLPIYLIIHWYLSRQEPKAALKEVSAWYDPPKTKEGRFLTSGETGGILKSSVDLKEVSSMLIELAQKGYLKIVETQPKKFSLRKMRVSEGDAELQPFESQFLSQVFSSPETKEVSISNTDLSPIIPDVKNKIYQSLMNENYYVKDPRSGTWIYVVLLILAFMSFNVLLVFSSMIFGLVLKPWTKKTTAGLEAEGVAKSLKNFLASQDRQLEFQAKNQLFFEKLLPYAVAFGVEKIWAERFADINLTQPTWYESTYNGTFSSAVFVSSLSSSMSQFQTAATPVSQSSGFSGGSSGGGGGGGGGGSW
jgi:hypothetical protein